MLINLLMAVLLAAGQINALFPRPVDYAIAQPMGKDVVVVVSYGGEIPEKACTTLYAIEDVNLETALRQHCWTPTNDTADFDVWKDETMQSMGNILCSIYHRNGRIEHMLLRYIFS